MQGCGFGQQRLQDGADPRLRTKGGTADGPLGFGPLLERPGQLLDLPAGFEYVVIQKGGDALSDGYTMPDQPDGMTCYTDNQGQYVLMRNHELGDSAFLKKRGYTHGFQAGQSVPQPCYDEKYFGGVTRVVLDPAQLQKDLLTDKGKKSSAVVSSNFVLAGTAVNCAGGHFAEGWVTCEESSDAGTDTPS